MSLNIEVRQDWKHFPAILVHQDSTEGNKFKDFLIKCSNSSRKHWIETWKEDIQLVVKGKPPLENREESILKKILDISGLPEVNRTKRER